LHYLVKNIKSATARKIWSDIPKHKRAKIVVEIWKVGSWNGEEL